DGALDGAALVQRELREEAAGVDAAAGERGADLVEHELDAARRQLRRIRVRGALDARGQLADVVAEVAVLRRLLAAGPGADRLAEAEHLTALVVHVVLALHPVAGELDDPAKGVAVGRVAPVPDRERPGRVAAHELDVQALRLLGRARAIAV